MEMNRLFVYGFEAKSIQRYIAETGRLRDVAGGSALIDQLAMAPDDDGAVSDRVQLVLQALGMPTVVFVRRAGGAFTFISEDRNATALFRAAYTLAVQKFAPGLPFVDAIVEGESLAAAFATLPDALATARARPSVAMPEAAPVFMQAARTGHPAFAIVDDEPIDEATFAKRPAPGDRNRRRAAGDLVGLDRRMTPPRRRATHVWPTELDAAGAPQGSFIFPGLTENATIGLLHADGNGLGATVIELADALRDWPDSRAAASFMMAFSSGVSKATERAVQTAVEDVLVGPESEWNLRGAVQDGRRVLAARPIVLGGDDLTLMVRGDLAFPFAECFLKAFEDETASAMNDVRTALSDAPAPVRTRIDGVLPRRLTAGAGVALVGASQPFDRANRFAESLAKAAKHAAKQDAALNDSTPPVSSIAFHRETSTLIDDHSPAKDGRLRVRSDGGDLHLTMGAYRVGRSTPHDACGLPDATALTALATLIADATFPSGPLRDYVGTLRTLPYEATRNYKRWREIMQARRPGRLDDFDFALRRLGVPAPADSPFAPVDRSPGRTSSSGGSFRTPLLDALSLMMSARRTLPAGGDP